MFNETEKEFEVIIVGGGPVGLALGIELGLHGINTLILEKHAKPLKSPRAQLLSPRTMEFMLRWGVSEKLRKEYLLGDYPMNGIWCSKLDGVVYANQDVGSTSDGFQSTEKSLRIPLWITEDILRSRIDNLKSVTFKTQSHVDDIIISDDSVVVRSVSDKTKEVYYRGKYVVGCDGAKSFIRQRVNIDFESISPSRRAINFLFESSNLQHKIKVGKGILYFILDNNLPVGIGPVDIDNGLWYAQIIYSGDVTDIENINIDQLLEDVTGLSFDKNIIDAHFWDMHIQIAEKFSSNNRVFLLGDSAHSFAPPGGFGLNTGFGDAVNLGWKLASVIKNKSPSLLLKSYEQERRSICLRNLMAAESNTANMKNVREKYPPEKNIKAFSKANEEVAKEHNLTDGLTMGYAYFDSTLTILRDKQNTEVMPARAYVANSNPGYFLPDVSIDEKSIYKKLSSTSWTLITSDQDAIPNIKGLSILQVPKGTYPYTYLLIRPDWHISYSGNSINSVWLNKDEMKWPFLEKL